MKRLYGEVMITRLIANRNLLKNLVLRDLKHRYVGSMGGFLWSVVQPLVLLVAYTFVFSGVLRQPMHPEFGTNSFPIFLFCGILPWLLFQDTLIRCCSSITDNAALITKTIIPAEILPMAITVSNLIHHMIGLTILFVVLFFFQGLHLSALWLLVYAPLLLMFAQGLGWIAAGLHVFVRDTIQALQILMFLWFWFTPVFYSMELVPPRMQFLVKLNPMAHIVTGYRNSLLHLSPPNVIQIAFLLAGSLLIFVIGALLFRQAKPAFPDVL
jgi:ABC-type polysaccharide/polyol phosphate export permease